MYSSFYAADGLCSLTYLKKTDYSLKLEQRDVNDVFTTLGILLL